MNKTSDSFLALKMHPCSIGLDDEALREIADSMELIHCSIGQIIHRAEDPSDSVYLIIHGRLSVTALDIQGNPLMKRYLGSGDQFGGLASALSEPSAVECVAEDPSTILRVDYSRGLELTRKYETFRANMTRLLAESVKRTILNDRLPAPPQVVAFLHQSDETRVVSARLFDRLVELGESPGVFTNQPVTDADGLKIRQTLGGERDWTLEEAFKQAGEWLGSSRLFIDYSKEVGAENAAIVLERCQLVFWCVTPGNWEASVPLLQEVEDRAPGWRDKIRILWLLEPGEYAPDSSELRKLAARDIKICFGEPGPDQGKLMFNGLDRLTHLVRGVKIGVALGGGAALGMAHLGVLKALEENGIFVDMIAGTSAGAMTGTLYAAGFNPDFLIEHFVTDLRPSWFFRCLPRGDQLYLLYKYRMGKFDPMLRKYLNDLTLEQLSLPMHCVTVDLVGGQSIVRDQGDAVHGILESINLPVLSKPINRAGQALVDGGLINNIPADVLVAKGCNFVIAVSVTAKLEQEFARNHPDTPAENMRSATTIQTVLRSLLVQSKSVNAIGVEPANLVIEPDLSGFELTEFTRADEMAAIGEQTTSESIPEIKRLLNRLDNQLFAN